MPLSQKVFSQNKLRKQVKGETANDYDMMKIFNALNNFIRIVSCFIWKTPLKRWRRLSFGQTGPASILRWLNDFHTF